MHCNIDERDALTVFDIALDAFIELSTHPPEPAVFVGALVLLAGIVERIRPQLDIDRMTPETRRVIERVLSTGARYTAPRGVN